MCCNSILMLLQHGAWVPLKKNPRKPRVFTTQGSTALCLKIRVPKNVEPCVVKTFEHLCLRTRIATARKASRGGLYTYNRKPMICKALVNTRAEGLLYAYDSSFAFVYAVLSIPFALVLPNALKWTRFPQLSVSQILSASFAPFTSFSVLLFIHCALYAPSESSYVSSPSLLAKSSVGDRSSDTRVERVGDTNH